MQESWGNLLCNISLGNNPVLRDLTLYLNKQFNMTKDLDD